MSDHQLSKPHQALHDAFTTALSTYRSPHTVELRGYYLQRLMTWAQDGLFINRAVGAYSFRQRGAVIG
ncbi:hypothetical protein BAURA86_03436 [Brevibacterium aurantiacum]|uniref:Uncharacterized protein n=1 Tax=Brevibacterium aurantiacum TaxID=273384 RepID=A0A2H1KVN2_BREAU|nr:hypothetical protein BAURA86_03436 [Brevibacterium aurantiacum]